MLLQTTKYFFFISLLCFSHILFAKNQVISPLPTPTQEVMDISIKKCSKSCLNKLYENGQYFSFIASYNATNDKALKDKFQTASNILDSHITAPNINLESGIRIALIIPQKTIGRYSITSADSILAYLIAHGDNFEFKVFDSQNEEATNLQQTYSKIQEEEYNYVIAILTPKGLTNLLTNTEITQPLFVPTIHEKQVDKSLPKKNVFFGGIDYEKQVNMIASLADSKNATVISLNDDGMIGTMLGEILDSVSKNVIVREKIDTKKSNNFKADLAKIKGSIKKSMIVLNTSAVKSGIIIPQVGSLQILPIAFLSTQINYNPALLGLISNKEDAQKLFIVNAISPVNIKLLAFSELLSADLQYDWVNYATALSLDILLKRDSKGSTRFFQEKIDGAQVIYNDRFYGVKDSHFIPIKIK